MNRIMNKKSFYGAVIGAAIFVAIGLAISGLMAWYRAENPKEPSVPALVTASLVTTDDIVECMTSRINRLSHTKGQPRYGPPRPTMAFGRPIVRLGNGVRQISVEILDHGDTRLVTISSIGPRPIKTVRLEPLRKCLGPPLVQAPVIVPTTAPNR